MGMRSKSAGLEAALERAERFVEAGADLTFVEAPTSVDEMRAITARLKVPQVANMVVGGKTPLLPQAEQVPFERPGQGDRQLNQGKAPEPMD